MFIILITKLYWINHVVSMNQVFIIYKKTDFPMGSLYDKIPYQLYKN